MISQLLPLVYLISVVLFIVGMKLMGNPDSARKGNSLAAIGMGLSVFITLLIPGLNNIPLIIIAIVLGSLGGLYASKKVQMTQMPELVSLFNGLGGGSALLIGVIEYQLGVNLSIGLKIVLYSSVIIGSISFTGSLIAMGKLNGKVKDWRPNPIVGALPLLATLAAAGYLFFVADAPMLVFYLMLFFALVYGIFFVLPIGGADMPVVISLLNSLTGVTAATTGLLYNNKAMLMGGILVGSAGLLLTMIMAKAMNRTLGSILFARFGGTTTTGISESKSGQSIREVVVYDAAILLSYAQKVIVVPGYGLAVAQAQHAIKELQNVLEAKGVEVKYGIHPVAGRMPGHMNVLLAESDVPYDLLLEMEDANGQFPTTDVVMVIGANDVVNPAALNDKNSPIYGMPILETHLAKRTIVIKRSMNAGYAGIENELFYLPNNSMLFGDAKAVINKLITEVKGM